MWNHHNHSLPEWIEEGYELLIALAEEGDEELDDFSREEALDLLLAHDTFPDEPGDAEYALDRLYNSGWIYKANGRLRITDPDWPPERE